MTITTNTPEVDRAVRALIDTADQRAAALVESMCDWTSNYRGAQATATHELWHSSFTCPYAAMAAVLRGQPDPRANHRLDHLQWWGNDSEWIVAPGHLDLEQFARDADDLARRDGSLDNDEVPSAVGDQPRHVWLRVGYPTDEQFRLVVEGTEDALPYTMVDTQ